MISLTTWKLQLRSRQPRQNESDWKHAYRDDVSAIQYLLLNHFRSDAVIISTVRHHLHAQQFFQILLCQRTGCTDDNDNEHCRLPFINLVYVSLLCALLWSHTKLADSDNNSPPWNDLVVSITGTHRPHAVRGFGHFLHISHVAWSVCLCAGNTGELCKHGWTDQDAVWGADSSGPRVLYNNPDPRGKGQFEGISPEVESGWVKRKMQLQSWVCDGDVALAKSLWTHVLNDTFKAIRKRNFTPYRFKAGRILCLAISKEQKLKWLYRVVQKKPHKLHYTILMQLFYIKLNGFQ